MNDKGNKEAEKIRKLEAVDIYEELLSKIWARTAAILGVVTVQAIMRRSVLLTQSRYPLIGRLEVREDGLHFEPLKEQMEPKARAVLKEGFEELVLQIFDLLAKLTGEIIVQKLFREVVVPRTEGERSF